MGVERPDSAESEDGPHLLAVGGDPLPRAVGAPLASAVPHSPERLMAGADGDAHDAVAPVVGVHERVDHALAVALRQPVGVDERAQPVERAAAERVWDVALIAERRP
jgi:hypothetical protein